MHKKTAPHAFDHISAQKGSIEYDYSVLMGYEPKPIPLFVPDNGPEQKKLFLSGQIENPQHSYGALDVVDFDQMLQGLLSESEVIKNSSAISPKYKDTYDAVIDDYEKKTAFLRAAHDYKHATTTVDREKARKRYMELNAELYGVPDEVIYHSLLADKMVAISAKSLTGKAATLRDELLEMLPDGQLAQEVSPRFVPSEETVAWIHDVAESLYGNLLQHVPEQETFTAQDICDLFNDIITQEFGDAADGWKAVVQTAKSLNVRAPEKQIIIPTDYADHSYSSVRKLVVHEIGVHMLRAVTGESTDADPLRYGLRGSYDTEEGLGVVMEQALEGKYVSSRGVPSYINAGAAYFRNMDFRQLFEFQWRLSALEGLATKDITDEQIEKKRSFAYNLTFRTLRGTDELPWFKDLAYFNGANDTWKHLESICGDDTEFMFVLASGKINPVDKEHRRLAREVRTP